MKIGKHSGNCGDCIFHLAAMKQVGIKKLYLKLHEPAGYQDYHPSGMWRLDEPMAKALIPLVESQGIECAIWNGEQVDVDFDRFRTFGQALDTWSIVKYPGLFLNIVIEDWLPWLKIEPAQRDLKVIEITDGAYYVSTINPLKDDLIVINRTHRYRNMVIDYRLLSKFHPLFLGLQNEYVEMRKVIPNLRWLPTDNFLQAAQIIAASKLYIGNQSACGAIAEGLKVNRWTEMYYKSPTALPNGENGKAFLTQERFAALINTI